MICDAATLASCTLQCLLCCSCAKFLTSMQSLAICWLHLSIMPCTGSLPDSASQQNNQPSETHGQCRDQAVTLCGCDQFCKVRLWLQMGNADWSAASPWNARSTPLSDQLLAWHSASMANTNSLDANTGCAEHQLQRQPLHLQPCMPAPESPAAR